MDGLLMVFSSWQGLSRQWQTPVGLSMTRHWDDLGTRRTLFNTEPIYLPQRNKSATEKIRRLTPHCTKRLSLLAFCIDWTKRRIKYREGVLQKRKNEWAGGMHGQR
jgi:hypothetical protein